MDAMNSPLLQEQSTQIFLRAIVGQWFSKSTYWTTRTLIKKLLQTRHHAVSLQQFNSWAAVIGSSAKLWKGPQQIDSRNLKEERTKMVPIADAMIFRKRQTPAISTRTKVIDNYLTTASPAALCKAPDVWRARRVGQRAIGTGVRSGTAEAFRRR